MKEIIRTILLSSCLLLAACSRDTVYSEFQSVPLNEWGADSVLTYRFNIEDTTATYQMIVCVRHTEQYPYQNMWLFVGDTLRQDTIEFYLANDRGEWLGNGRNGLIEMPVLYEEAYRFAHSGEQVWHIQQGMREENLRGVSDVGFIITKNGKE